MNAPVKSSAPPPIAESGYVTAGTKWSMSGKACDAPKNICMTFNGSAESLTKYGYARPVDVAEGLDLLQQAWEHNLVQFGENVRQGVNFICNCCGCCCEAMIAARRFAYLNPVHTTNFIVEVNVTDCNGCGKCVSACPVEAMTLVSANDRSPAQPQESPVERRTLPGMRGVRPHLQPQWTQPAVKAGAGDHPAEFGASGGDDGHRTRRPAGAHF